MFRVQIGDLERRGRVQIHHRIPAEDGLWEDSELTFAEAPEVELTLTMSGTGQVIARGGLRTVLRHACRRCLTQVDRNLEFPLHLVWSPPDELSEVGGEDEGLRILAPDAREIDLGEAVREELVLAAPRWVVCREDCRGLCPQCGKDRNDGDCECARAEPDPRWDALRALEKE